MFSNINTKNSIYFVLFAANLSITVLKSTFLINEGFQWELDTTVDN